MNQKLEPKAKYPSTKGFPLSRVVTVPNTTAQAKQLREQQQTLFDANAARVDTFSESSALSMTDARNFVDENHYKTIITTNNPWTDPVTGKVYLFEKKEPKFLEL